VIGYAEINFFVASPTTTTTNLGNLSLSDAGAEENYHN